MTDYTLSQPLSIEAMTTPQFAPGSDFAFYDVVFEGTLDLPLPYPRIMGDDGFALPTPICRDYTTMVFGAEHCVLDASCGVFAGVADDRLTWSRTPAVACIEGKPKMVAGRGTPVVWSATQ